MMNRLIVTCAIICVLLGAAPSLRVGVAGAQTRADTVSVLRAVIKNVEDPLGKGVASPGRRIGLVNASFRVSETWRARTFPPATSSRARALDEEIVAAGTHVKLAAPFESQPRECVPRQSAGKTATVCIMRDFNVLIALSAPLIDGNTATVHLHRKENGSSPGQPFGDGWFRYELERGADGIWTVKRIQVLQIS